MLYASCPVGRRADYVDQRRLALARRRSLARTGAGRGRPDWRRPTPTPLGNDPRLQCWSQANTRPPHPVSLYTFKAPNGVRVPAHHACASLRFQRRTGGFQRPTPVQVQGSSATQVGSSAPRLCRFEVLTPHWWVPAPHACAGLRFQRHTAGFQRPAVVQA